MRHKHTADVDSYLLREAVDSLAAGLLILDSLGSVAYMSLSAARALRVDRKWSIGTGAAALCAWGSNAEPVWNECLRDRVPAGPRLETCVLEDGVKRLLRCSATPLWDADGGFAGVAMLVDDVTERVESERASSDFVSTVSHELRTPIASIKGYVDVILDGDAGDLNETQRDFLTIVARNNERLLMLINDLLDISRIESGSVRMDKRIVRADELVRSIASQMRGLFEEKEIRLVVECPEELPTIYADPGRIEQALANLLTNAAKFTPKKGKVQLAAQVSAGSIVFSVADTGCGIAEDEQARVFEKFYRASNAESSQVRGCGLGLSIVKSIVERHGGRAWVESTLGVGSTFYLALPLETGADESFVAELARIAAVEATPDETVGLIMVGLGNYDALKSAHGEEYAGRALTLLGKRAKEMLRSADLVSGYKQMVVGVLRAVDPKDIARILQRLRQAIIAPFHIDGKRADLCVMVGGAATKAGGLVPERLLAEVEAAMEEVSGADTCGR